MAAACDSIIKPSCIVGLVENDVQGGSQGKTNRYVTM
jgi:hypothetical protein